MLFRSVELKILSSNENIIIGDVKPGDISTCISKKKYANLYQPGDFAIVYLSKNGKYYLSLGSYFEALHLHSLVLFGLFFCIAILKDKRSSITIHRLALTIYSKGRKTLGLCSFVAKYSQTFSAF